MRMARLLAQREWDKDKPTLSWASACSDAALKLYWEDGRDMKHIKQVRDLFRGADQRTIFLAWTGMELGHGDTAAARACFEEWLRPRLLRSRRRRLTSGATTPRSSFSTGRARARTRAVAEAALAACPRDPEVFAMYACLELRMYAGPHRRTRATSDVLPADDEDSVKCLRDAARGEADDW